MSDLTTYRIDWVEMERRYPDISSLVMQMDDVIVPDTRLQAIADAWNEYRLAARSGSDDELIYHRNRYESLLDALTQEDTDE